MAVPPVVSRTAPALLTALAYVLAGQLALGLAAYPAYAAPLFPAAGLALAAVLVYGWRALPGVVLGAFIVSGVLSEPHGLRPAAAWFGAGLIGLGAAAQAAVGAWLMRRKLSGPVSLAEPRDALGLCLWGAAVACLVNAAVAGANLWLVQKVPGGSALVAALTWWSGDALGVLIGTPIALTLIGRPRELWAPRRLTVALPLLVVTAALTLAMITVAGGDWRRGLSVFERDASQVANALEGGLQTPVFALEATRSLFVGSDNVGEDEMRLASEFWLKPPSQLLAVAFSQRVDKARLAEFEAGVQAEGLPAYRVFQRADSPAALTANDTDVVAIRHIVPLESNRRALGVNALSIPAARAAIARAALSDAPAATAGFKLTQDAGGEQTGVVIYRAIYQNGLPPEPAGRREALRGVVSVVLRMGSMVQGVIGQAPAYLDWCLVDTDPSAERIRLAGPAGCENASPGKNLRQTRQLAFAGRQWELRMSANPNRLPGSDHWTLWFFSVTGLLSVGMLSTVLLTITGRARRIEVAVNERTADLQREVRERERTEQALRDSERRFRNILDHLPLGVVYTDLAGQIHETNPRMRELLGFDAKTLRQRAIGDLIHPEDRADVDALLARLVKGGPALMRHRLRLQRSDTQVIWMEMGLSLLRNARGSAQRLVGVFEDITEHLLLADAERARESAEAASQAKSEFLSRMSHELRTPLNAILGFTQLVALDRQPPVSERQREWTLQVQQAGWHLLRMIDEMLDLSRIEAGQLRLELGAVALAPILRESLSLIEQDATARQLQLETLFDPGALAVKADSTRLKQILINLLSNAVKYNVTGGRLECVTERLEDGRIALKITDSGLGMDASQLERLFQPFNRLGREQSRTEGTGLGLVISRRLAELMGGSLVASSVAERGSTFTLTLQEADLDTVQALATRDLPSVLPDYRYRQVHYIEDNETNAEVMRGILAQRPQVRLTVSETGTEGLAALRRDPPNVLLLDMHLPDLDGLEVLRRLRADPDTADIPVIVVSADATTTRIEQAFAEGATEYTTKPVDVASFLAQLDGLLDRQDTRFS